MTRQTTYSPVYLSNSLEAAIRHLIQAREQAQFIPDAAKRERYLAQLQRIGGEVVSLFEEMPL